MNDIPNGINDKFKDCSSIEIDPDLDMAQYPNELFRIRQCQTLTMRQIPSATVIPVPTLFTLKEPSSASPPVFSQTENPIFFPSTAINIINYSQPDKINYLAEQISKSSKENPRLLQNLAHSTQFEESLTNLLQSEDLCPPVICSILSIISSIFPLIEHETIQSQYVDDLFFSILNLLQDQSENIDVLLTSISFVAIISYHSAYARDMLVQNEVHIILLTLCEQSSDNPQLQVFCLQSILQIFKNPSEMETSTFKDCVTPLSNLLSSENPKVLQLVINIFVEMTNRVPLLTIALFETSIFQKLLTLILNEELITPCLHLIGNMSLSQPSHIEKILQFGLFDILMNFINTSHCADIFWILSNMLESGPYLMIPLFTEPFLLLAIEAGSNGSFDLQKEIAFFLATLIIHSEKDNLMFFSTPKALSLIIEMFSCGVLEIVLRCLDAIVRLMLHFHTLGKTQELSSILEECDINQQLEEIIEHNSSNLIKQRAIILRHQLDLIDHSTK